MSENKNNIATYFKNSFYQFFSKDLIKFYTEGLAKEMPGSSGEELLEQMVNRFYIEFNNTLEGIKDSNKQTILLDIEFQNILLKTFYMLVYKKKDNTYHTPKDIGNHFIILEQDLSFTLRDKFINIIKNNNKNYDNSSLFFAIGRTHSFKETSRWLQLTNKKYNPEITLMFNYISHVIVKNLVTGVINENERTDSKNKKMYELDGNSESLHLYFLKLLNQQLVYLNIAAASSNDVNKMKMRKFLNSIENLLNGKPDNLKYAEELGFKNFSATKEYLPIDFSEYQNQKNEIYDKKNISSEKKITKTKAEINTIIFCAVFFVIGIIVYNILTN